jgi:hypothetical protein
MDPEGFERELTLQRSDDAHPRWLISAINLELIHPPDLAPPFRLPLVPASVSMNILHFSFPLETF